MIQDLGFRLEEIWAQKEQMKNGKQCSSTQPKSSLQSSEFWLTIIKGKVGVPKPEYREHLTILFCFCSLSSEIFRIDSADCPSTCLLACFIFLYISFLLNNCFLLAETINVNCRNYMHRSYKINENLTFPPQKDHQYQYYSTYSSGSFCRYLHTFLKYFVASIK